VLTWSKVPSGQASGVRYITGDAGWVKQLIYDDSGHCIGALSHSGQAHLADIVILCTGANTAALIEAKDEIVARSHCVGVIQLNPEEVEKYKDLPIVDDFEHGQSFSIPKNKICRCI
jgi:sarcosine oxidase/L-pipecolate oxidase